MGPGAELDDTFFWVPILEGNARSCVFVMGEQERVWERDLVDARSFFAHLYMIKCFFWGGGVSRSEFGVEGR